LKRILKIDPDFVPELHKMFGHIEEKVFVLCEVGVLFYNIWLSLSPQGRAVAEEATRQPVISKARVRCRGTPCEVCNRQRGNGTCLYPSTLAVPVSIIPPMMHTHLHLNISFTRRISDPSLETFKQSCAVSNVGGRWAEKYFYTGPSSADEA
jgi:hypothetical protein